MKFSSDRPPWSDSEKATQAPGDRQHRGGRTGWPDRIEKINAPFLFRERATPAEYSAGLKLAIERGWLVMHECGTFVRFTQAGADLFA